MTAWARHVLVGLVLALTGCSGAQRVLPPKGAENGTWSICYDEAGMPDLYENHEQNPPCDAPRRIRWDRLPVRAWVDPDTVDSTVALRAFAAWEEWLARPVFVLVPEVEDADVVIWADAAYLADICGPSAAACAPHRRNSDGTVLAGIVFDPEYLQIDVLAHELGHTMGLAHDPSSRRSIMYPSMDWYLPRLSAYDTALLQALYQGR